MSIWVFWSALANAGSLSFSSSINYDDEHPSNIVAVVIGYQNFVKHKSGVTIPTFSIDDGAGDGKERGVLFYILAPTNYAGYVFFADCLKDSFSDAQTTPSEEYFPKNELLSFRLSDFPIHDLLRLHCYIGPNPPLSTGNFVKQRYLASEQEAEIYLTQMKTQVATLENEHKRCGKILEEEEKSFIKRSIYGYKNDNSETTRKYRETTIRKRKLTRKIREIELAIKDAEEQLGQLKARSKNRHE